MKLSINIELIDAVEGIEILQRLSAATPQTMPMQFETPAPKKTNEGQNNTADSDPAEIDADNQPWDARIHSRGKTQNADGTWRLARGVDPKLVEQVRAEHIATLAVEPAADAAVTETAAASAPAAPPPPPAPTSVPEPAAPPPAPAPDNSIDIATTQYRHGNEVYYGHQLQAAGWSEEDITGLPVVPDAESPVSAPPMTFADLAKRLADLKLDAGAIDATVVEVATAVGKPQINTLALVASPANRDVFDALVARLWPEG